jgi:hypothetical protein
MRQSGGLRAARQRKKGEMEKERFAEERMMD